jgi:hypothetical protein
MKLNSRNEHRKEFFDALADHLGYQSMEDWYSVRYADLKEFGGAGLMASYYRDSVYQALRDVYPTHTWVVRNVADLVSKRIATDNISFSGFEILVGSPRHGAILGTEQHISKRGGLEASRTRCCTRANITGGLA